MRRSLGIISAFFVATAAFAQTVTMPISSALNPISSDVSLQMSLTPIDVNGAVLGSLTQGWPASSLQQTTVFNFPANQSAYTLGAIRASITPSGTGFTALKDSNGNPIPLLLDYAVTPPQPIPAGVPFQAVVNFSLVGLGSLQITVGPDRAPPSAPSNLTVTPAQTTADASWTGSTDNVGVVGYVIERAPGTTGSFAQIAATSATSFSDSGLTAATVYSYRVKSADAAGNFSPYSNVAVITTTLTTPPAAGTPSPPGSCTAPAAVSGCASPLPKLVDSTGAIWTLVAGAPFRNGVKTNNPYSPGINYLFVNAGNPNTIRSRNANGTYYCVNPSTNVWQGSGC